MGLHSKVGNRLKYPSQRQLFDLFDLNPMKEDKDLFLSSVLVVCP
uniref:Uncharacterized protein n=1 Tax=Candidatus Kentrum eta TaxID=2126337 RepID=A0A450VJG9_9GAMM|nr:MAG: hypothetical protein BECKH772B_GA0070898_102387 [Candidatus Kentron sp. H]VFK04952.1 MAG: hypothetical protein BECKH772C_GA0070978_102237 [Candidatus Kentron sp. H]